MKHIIYTIITAALLFTYGCEDIQVGNDFLEKAPGVDVNINTIFSDPQLAENFLWSAYETIPKGMDQGDKGTVELDKIDNDILESMTDISQTKLSWGGVYKNYYSGNYNADSENSSIRVKYSLPKGWALKGIRKCYIFIENIDRVPNMDPIYVRQLKAEAKTIIALHYCDLLRNFGGFPLLDRAYDTENELGDMRRMTAQETCDHVIELLDEAIPDLPWVITDLANWEGRMTKAAAMGLKARTLLFNASPIFNAAEPYLAGQAATEKLVWHGGYNKDLWKEAADAAKALIDKCEQEGGYSLNRNTSNYRKAYLFGYFNRGSSELLISARDQYYKSTWGGNNFYATQLQWGATGVTNEFVEKFGMANGKAITDPTSGYDPNFPFFDAAGNPVRDPRLYENVLVNGDNFKGRKAELYIGGRERTSLTDSKANWGFGLRKFAYDEWGYSSKGSVTQFPYLRLPEIYLSYAEAINEYNDGPTTEAYRCIEEVRSRVGLDPLPTNLSKEQFREAVINERTCELAWELVHWYDIIRWKRDFDFTKPLHGLNTTKTGSTLTYEIVPNPETIYWKKNWSPKWYMSAFPSDEIRKGYGLIQNPGWEQ